MKPYTEEVIEALQTCSDEGLYTTYSFAPTWLNRICLAEIKRRNELGIWTLIALKVIWWPAEST